ncbi:uncharacterized protein LOC18424326 [Amborella trichopoda]|uniref:uncharacterized protein LOC18424326 n=1 Tax=Amborella trichopoda TaxID=13333 RepID=UPI0005D32FBE|nr:uncharacterized protein LOC18424326 [Amborella trichopoda]|eukprot:XP_011628971.1 uncharacterized protein LOC18424326 [Amborella trichopoda]
MEKETRATGQGGLEKWKRMVDAMTNKYGSRNSESRLKRKHKFFRIMYFDIKKLVNVSGFGLDNSRRIATADVAVWNDFLAENEWANKYQNKTLPEYSVLSKIYGGGTADGTYKSIGGGIRIEPKRPNIALSCDPPLEVQDGRASIIWIKKTTVPYFARSTSPIKATSPH